LGLPENNDPSTYHSPAAFSTKDRSQVLEGPQEKSFRRASPAARPTAQTEGLKDEEDITAAASRRAQADVRIP